MSRHNTIETRTYKLALVAFSVSSVLMAKLATGTAALAQGDSQRPNILMLMTDDTGWNDFGVNGGGVNFGHPTPNIDRVGQEGALFTSWYGQASCTAGRASFVTGRIPIP